MTAESLKEAIKRELPGLLREDPAFRDFVLELTRHEYAPRHETADWVRETLADLRRDREAQSRKWAEYMADRERDRAEQAKKWEEQAKRWEEQRAASERDRAEQAKKWEEQAKRWEEQRAASER
ncbi:MAG: hypothetical protein EA400_18160, partial [Chromatiaceae bacterium]